MCKEPLHLACSERVVREDRRGRKREEAEVTCAEKGKEKRAGEGAACSCEKRGGGGGVTTERLAGKAKVTFTNPLTLCASR